MNDTTSLPSDQHARATDRAGAGSSALSGTAPRSDEAAASMAVPPGATENVCDGVLWKRCD